MLTIDALELALEHRLELELDIAAARIHRIAVVEDGLPPELVEYRLILPIDLDAQLAHTPIAYMPGLTFQKRVTNGRCNLARSGTAPSDM